MTEHISLPHPPDPSELARIQDGWRLEQIAAHVASTRKGPKLVAGPPLSVWRRVINWFRR